MKTKIISLLATFLSMLVLTSCDKMEDRLPSMSPFLTVLTEENPIGYLTVGPEDYNIVAYQIDTMPIMYIFKNVGVAKSEVVISEHYKLKIYCHGSKVQKLDFGFMTVEKIAPKKYKVTRINQPQMPTNISLAVKGEDGFSDTHIKLK